MPISSDSLDMQSSSRHPLSERVQERVNSAAARIAAAARAHRRRKAPVLGSSGKRPQEVQALYRVFHEMGRSQRSARRETGQAPSPIVKQAAQAFQETPSIASLVLVAASLDEVGLLPW